MIKRVQVDGKTQYCLFSRAIKKLGCYPTRKGAEDREKQVLYFKNKKNRRY